MEKQLLEEINRTREIMGLEVVLEQDLSEKEKNESLKKIEDVVNEIIGVFKQIDPAEREEFKTVLIKDIKSKKFDATPEEKEEIIKKLLEEFKKVESTPIKEQAKIGGKYVSWREWRARRFWGLINLLTLNLVKVRGWTKEYRLFGRRGIGIKIKGARKGGKGELSSLDNLEPDTPEEEWEDLINSRLAKKFKKHIVKGKNIWEESWDITSTNDDGEETYTYRPLMIAALERYESFDRWGRRKVRITISDKPEETKIPIETEKTYEAKEFMFPAEGQPSADFFEDNEFAPTQAFKDNLQTEIIGPLQEVAATLNPPEGKPAYWLRTLGISTSCSARNNGKSSDGKTRTWVELAEARAQAGLAYIKEELAKLDPPMLVGSNGGTEETEIVINAKGDNDGKNTKDGRDLTGTSGPVWGESGESTNVADYEKYKYFNVAFDILVNDSEEQKPENDTTWETVYSDKLAISYNIPSRSADWRTLNIKFRLPKLRPGLPFFGWFAGIFKKRKNLTDCPAF